MTKISEKDMTTKGNILNSTLELIKTEGLENVTLRKIAALAEVNLALINYYFGSKDKLINEALKVLLASFREAFLILDDHSIPPKKRLKTFMVQYVHSVIKYPVLVREILGKGNISFESQFEYKNYMETMGFTKIKDTLQEITGEKDPDILTMMMMQIHAAIFFPSLMACKKNVPLVWNPIPIEEQIDYFFQHYFAKYS
ncbi:TetR/AcrR family transcriptional regulator [Priestia megaterium]|uniref:TetR/AcrR family transcriptional regulator n=1 Tax=Priestia megaterium TaxID=1404 RepID=A0A6H1NWK5_PRIMG|nr:TetR/AcrR family transcriptional regulator [Priestia megaterium]QIZ05587.1 TetR/AcrR family transcriptional regulator [Priestia megaterium]